MNGIEYLLDTNIVIGLLKQDSRTVALTEHYKIEFDRCAVSQITRMELLGFPGLQESEQQEIREFLDNCTVILLDAEIEDTAITLRRSGKFKLPDAIIAATAKTKKLTLLTLDEKLEATLKAV